MRASTTTCGIVAVWIAMCAGPLARGQAAPPVSPDEEIRALADRLLDEAERQHMVNRRMDASVRGFDSLIRDLLSNDLLAQGKGPQMRRFMQVLGVLNIRHVPNAEKYLQEARRRLEAFRPNVTAADSEIQIILKMLDELLKKAQNVRSEDDLLTQLRLILRNEENLHQQTREWGKLLYKDPKQAETSREELTTRQQQIAASVRQFEDKLNETARSESDPMRRQDLAKASQAMKEGRIDKTLDKAAEEIDTKKPIPAVQKQAEALEKLREVEKLLLAQEDSPLSTLEEMKDSYQQLSDILDRQEKLTAETRQVPEQSFPEKSKDLQIEQHNIQKDLGKTTREMPEAADPEVRQPLQQAQQHMDSAEKSMEKNAQKPAVQEQEKAEESLKQALKKLEEQMAQLAQQLAQQQASEELDQQYEQAIEQTQSLLQRQEQLNQLTQQSAPQQMGELAKPQEKLSAEAQALSQEAQPLAQQAAEALQQASGEMQQASQAMDQGQKPQAQQHQQQAMQALQQAAQQLQQAQQAAQQQAQRGQPQNPQNTPPQPSPQQTTDPKELGSRNFGMQRPGGRIDDDKKLWDHLNPKEREALKQRFARELPLEYRELLEDYYEALSK